MTAVLTVLVPAHNEADVIGHTLDALARQTRPADRVVVVADNCTDGTEEVAREHGAQVLATVGNTDRKAGALNQALAEVTTEYVMVLDADTRVAPTFIEEGLALLTERLWVAAVGGVFTAVPGSGLLWQAQANEFTRYGVQIDVTGRTSVLTGTAAIIRAEAARDVARNRGARLPGQRGDVYDRTAITEDSEFTLALKTLGWRVESPVSMTCETETMPTWADLHRQRVRWYSGMLENLRSYGWSRTTRRYFGQQAMLAIGTVMLWVLVALTLMSVLTGTFALSPFWLIVGGVFFVERLVTVWDGGARARVLAVCLLPELIYDMWLQAAFVRAMGLAATRRETTWNHVASAPAGR